MFISYDLDNDAMNPDLNTEYLAHSALRRLVMRLIMTDYVE